MTKPSAKKQEGSERLEALRKKLRDDPRSLAFVELAEELNRIGAHAEAAEVANRGLLSHPDSVAGRLALAVAEAEQDHIREALEQIKRALLIDQENPKALALMGRILLKKGLAKRAVQFLSHAVKLDPKEKEYGELLKEARAAAKSSGEAAVPVFDASQVPDSSNPWNEDENSSGGLAGEAEHTVFDPDALKKLKKKPSKADQLDRALQSLPDVGDAVGEEEPTKFHHRKGAEPEGREEPTKFATESPLKKRAKMGGSAAEYSQMMKKAEAEAVREEAERRVRAEAPKPPPPPVPPVSDLENEPLAAPRPEAEVRPPPKAPSVERELATHSVRAKNGEPAKVKEDKAREEKPKEEKAKEDKPKEEKAPAMEKKDPPPPPKPEPQKQVGHVATRMVDEALWALLGGKGAEPEGKRPEPDAKPARAEPKAEKKAAKEESAPEPRPGAPMVVRTSERFGTWTAVAVLLILCVAALWTGYAIAIAARGPGPETATEELKGLASDLERGGLAALLAAEEKIAELETTNPSLHVLLSGALAEVHARRWEKFGREAKILERAHAEVKEASVERPSVELLTAMTVLSSSAASLATIDQELERLASEYKESPKIWVQRAKVAERLGRADDVPAYLYKALSINPQHRLTLLELARWHGSQGAHGTAFSLFDQIQDRYPTDVEAALDRYVLGQITGKDPNEAQAVSTLAGLVRDEIPDVAKDEAGRAGLVFAVSKFAKGDLVEGLAELSKADKAFNDSAEFKNAVAGVYLAVGEHARAREHYSRALEIEPNNPEHRFGLARCTLLERSGRKVTAEEEKKRLKDKPMKDGVADLPFATVRFVFNSFTMVKVEPDASFFPEGEYRTLAKKSSGAELTKALEAASLRMLARTKSRDGKHDEAINLLKEAVKLSDDPSSEYALGLAHLAKKDFDEAERLLKNAIDDDDDAVAARLALARAHLGKSEEAKALQVLDQIDGDVLAPDALILKGKLKLQRGDYEGALTQLAPLAEMLPKNQTVQILCGETFYRLGQYEEADQSFARALALGGKLASSDPAAFEEISSVALVGLGRVEVKQNLKRGLAFLRAAEKREDVPDDVFFYLGEALLGAKSKKTQRVGEQELKKFIKLSQNGELKTKAEKLLKER